MLEMKEQTTETTEELTEGETEANAEKETEEAETEDVNIEDDPFLAKEKAPEPPPKKVVTVISETGGFLLEAICSNIRNAQSLSVNRVIADAGSVPDIITDTDILVLYIEENHRYMDKLLGNIVAKYVNSHKDIPVFLAGGPNELLFAKKKLIRVPIARTFCRPINVKELTEELEYLANDKNFQVRKRVLIVDDDPITITTLQAWFANLFMVYSANSGSNALTFLDSHDVDLILLDYEMPLYDGPTTLRMIRQKERSKNIPVIFLTSRNDRESVLSIKDLNVERYLLKSLSFEEITEAVQEYFYKQPHA